MFIQSLQQRYHTHFVLCCMVCSIWAVLTWGGMNTNMSVFIGLSPNKDLKNGLIRAESVFLAYLARLSLAYCDARDTDMSTFMGLSPNKDMENGLIRAELVFLAYVARLNLAYGDARDTDMSETMTVTCQRHRHVRDTDISGTLTILCS